MDKKNKIKPDVLSKTLAGLVFGYLIALALVGLFAWHGYQGISGEHKVQFNMWMITPIWMLTFSFSYLFQSGKKAILTLFSVSVVLHFILYISKASIS
ncbi:hypothetical protein [Parashewanella tropica]|uniref:hypothetical protein n=1 Tax=Parashewanella tropica TaxID=2547970 RepID=UPI00105A4C23|nr:hypothetical protein [Parashewanella tropica]